MIISNIEIVDNLLICGYKWRISSKGNSYFILYSSPRNVEHIVDVDFCDEPVLKLFINDFLYVLDNLSWENGFCEVKYDFDKRKYVSQILEKVYLGPYGEDSFYNVINEGDGEDLMSSFKRLEDNLKRKNKHGLVRVNRGGLL